MSWKPEVYVPGEDKWHGNGLCFATEEEALRWGCDLLGRWFVPTEYRAVESEEPVNYRVLDDGKVEVMGGRQDGAVLKSVSVS